uniref:50S ribosomal protein L9 n=1 Tax=Dictyotopsis propagulifera TaxID=670095 RepID=UPI002E79779C|nr:50S ribosomal protein L9 [Dictyotopsis propagulifera]WAM63255.1 50S ribosomal protein L9 [Dictyotopsis propagulifera]
MIRKIHTILLTQKVRGLGEPGQIVKVKAGYSRNYIIPFKFGKHATRTLISEFNLQQEQILLKEQNLFQKSTKFKNLIESLQQLILKKEVVNNTTHLFGKITKSDIFNLIQEKLEVTEISEIFQKNHIILPKIEELGEYKIEIKLSKEISALISLNIIAA